MKIVFLCICYMKLINVLKYHLWVSFMGVSLSSIMRYWLYATLTKKKKLMDK